jgi:hypothetical protein
MSHNLPSWVAEEPSKSGRSVVQGFRPTRQKNLTEKMNGHRSKKMMKQQKS